jgi:mono/diheme cytochrome c family protein
MVRRWLAGYALFAAVGAIAGCGKGDPAATGPQVTYDQHCARCHARAGEPGGPGIGGSRGPNLAKIGAAPGHTAEWLADFIRDPKSQRPDASSLMPAFRDTLTDAQIKELAEWLAAKK